MTPTQRPACARRVWGLYSGLWAEKPGPGAVGLGEPFSPAQPAGRTAGPGERPRLVPGWAPLTTARVTLGRPLSVRHAAPPP